MRNWMEFVSGTFLAVPRFITPFCVYSHVCFQQMLSWMELYVFIVYLLHAHQSPFTSHKSARNLRFFFFRQSLLAAFIILLNSLLSCCFFWQHQSKKKRKFNFSKNIFKVSPRNYIQCQSIQSSRFYIKYKKICVDTIRLEIYNALIL